jgi:N-acetylmuramoyl-L-alanine amidase
MLPANPRQRHLHTSIAGPTRRRRSLRVSLLVTLVTLVALLAPMVSVGGAAASEIVVSPGDTLSELARSSGVTVDELTEVNAISNPDLVIAGSTLRLPTPPRTHVVVDGDTLWRIARAEGTTVAALMDLNDLEGPRIRIGERLLLPPERIEGAEWGGSRGGPDAVDTTAADIVASDAASAPRMLITPTGVVAPIITSDAAGWLVRTPCGNQATVAEGTVVGDVDVVLDPGHGGWESAAVGPNGLLEKDLNLTVALRTAELLEARGYRVGLTRQSDIYVPIAGRAAIVNAWQPDLFVSIHHNGGALTPRSTPGTQVYHQHADPQSKRAAGVLYEELYDAALQFPTAWVGNALDGVSARLGETGDDFYGVLRLTQGVPTALTEFLWLSNGPEAQLLARGDVQEAQAQALVDGIVRWFETDDAGSGFIGSHTDSYDSGGGGLSGCVDPALVE